MTKCALFWKKVQEFKEKDDFQAFMDWCGYKSYEQARRDWNAVDTFAIIAKKLGQDICEIVSSETLTEDALNPIIHQRKDLPTGKFGKRETIPSPVQECAINYLLPKIKAGEKITQDDSKRAVFRALDEAKKDWTQPPVPNMTKKPETSLDTIVMEYVIIGKITESQARQILTAPLEKQKEIVEYIKTIGQVPPIPPCKPEEVDTGFEWTCPECPEHKKFQLIHVNYPDGTVKHKLEAKS